MILIGNISRRIAFLTLILCSILATACSSHNSGLPRIKISFQRASGDSTHPFSMEVATTEPERARGLMYRKELARDAGMIFVFPQESDHRFWMKNTFIPLDMVYVSEDLRVVGILENVPPLTEDGRSVGKPSLYVLEFAAGTMRENNVTVGARLVLEGEFPKAL